ncbi:hypothetical protein [Eggerthia catenaformis]|nr:hypothetical protein [Eggerthia catenaformis]
MLIEMKSPAFKERGKERPPITFKEGLNVVLGKEDGAMSMQEKKKRRRMV